MKRLRFTVDGGDQGVAGPGIPVSVEVVFFHIEPDRWLPVDLGIKGHCRHNGQQQPKEEQFHAF